MTYLQSILLGIVQGITEFLPISSSAHLVIVPELLGWQIPPEEAFPFDVLVQLGTLVAVIIYFRKDLAAILAGFLQGIRRRDLLNDTDARLGIFIIIATIPAGFIGLLMKNLVETAFGNPLATCCLLVVTGCLLILAEKLFPQQRELRELKLSDALWIGLAQAFAIFPGISRSGSTIFGGMARKFIRKDAARFSFLMSIPIMLAAGIFSIKDMIQIQNISHFLPVLAAGFITAGITGYLSIHWLLRFLSNKPLTIFAVYCFFFAAVSAYVIMVP